MWKFFLTSYTKLKVKGATAEPLQGCEHTINNQIQIFVFLKI